MQGDGLAQQDRCVLPKYWKVAVDDTKKKLKHHEHYHSQLLRYSPQTKNVTIQREPYK